MSDEFERVQFHKNPFMQFRNMLIILAENFGIYKDRQSGQYVDLLVRSLNEKIFDTENPKRKKDLSETQKFISNFKRRYLFLVDEEYMFNKKIDSKDYKGVERMVEKLKEYGSNIDDYLKWFFEVFLQSNTSLIPPTLGLAYSFKILPKYLYANKDKIEQNKENEIRKKDEKDVAMRFRVILRQRQSQNKDISGIRNMMTQYKKGFIEMKEMKAYLLELEEEEGIHANSNP